MRQRDRQSGFSRVGLLLTVPAIVVIGIGGTLIYQHNTVSLHAKSVSTTVPVTSTNNFVIPELGIKLTLPTGLAPSDIQYYAQIDRPGTTADPNRWSTVSFTTKSLLQLDSGCTAAEGSIGMIVRYVEDPKAIKAEVRASRPLGNHYFAFAAPQGSCSINPDAQKLENAQIGLLQQAFETVSAGN